jgi:hypothetical protein
MMGLAEMAWSLAYKRTMGRYLDPHEVVYVLKGDFALISAEYRRIIDALAIQLASDDNPLVPPRT